MTSTHSAVTRRSFVSGLAMATTCPSLAFAQAIRSYSRGARVPDGLLNRMQLQNRASAVLTTRLKANPSVDEVVRTVSPPVVLPPSLPVRYDWRDTNHVTPVRNQGSCGSCWIFAALAAYELSYLITNKGSDPNTLEVSEQEILDCAFQETNCVVGGWHEVVFTYLLTLGAIGSNQYPYNSDSPQRGNFCNSNFGARPYYARNWNYVSTDVLIPAVEVLKKAVLQNGPLACGVSAGSTWDSYAGGVIDGPASSGNAADVNHEVVIVGWDDTLQGANFPAGAWIVKNSWGEQWGGTEKGFVKIPYGSSNIGLGAAWVSVWPEATATLPTVKAISERLKLSTWQDLQKEIPGLELAPEIKQLQ